jgi:hypothetical protein
MSEVKGTIKVLESKIIIKTEKGSETWIKKSSISFGVKEWIEYKGQVYELESFEIDDDVI